MTGNPTIGSLAMSTGPAKTIRWGMIGCGDVTEVKSAPAFNRIPGSRLVAVMSRTADSRPPERVRARRANRRGVDLVVSFAASRAEPGAVYYFASKHACSSAGELLANSVAARLQVATEGRSTPMLRETRPPAVVVCVDGVGAETGRVSATAIAGFFTSPLSADTAVR